MLGAFIPFLTELPILARFAIAMAVILTVPALCRRLRLPAVVGFVAFGLISGPHGLQIGPKHNEVVEYFAEIGKLLLMFFAGLEIDLQQFVRTRKRSLCFGMATFAAPLAAGVFIGLAFGYGALAAVLIGSLLASHTLLGFPIVQKLGLVRNEPVTVAIGATIFTDVAALLVLAVCIPIHASGFSAAAFGIEILQLAIYMPLVLFGLSAVVAKVIERMPDSKSGQFLVMLLAMAVAAIGAEAIHLEGIIGAFLTGLALNRAVHHSPAKAELEFLGETLFIPVFFVSVGYLIDIRVFVNTIVAHAGLVASIIAGLVGAKLLAAVLVRRVFGYSWPECGMMWALTLPQVAATLAAALVAFNATNGAGQRLIDEPVLNSVIVLMVATSIMGPLLTEWFGHRMAHPPTDTMKPTPKPGPSDRKAA